jgi:HSP20 family molecular chaperone IbpA
MGLTTWDRFRGLDDPSPSAAFALWRRNQRQAGKRPDPVLSEAAGGFIARTRMRGLGDGDVVVSLQDDVLVIQGELQQTNGYATFKGLYSCRFDLPANIDVKGLRLVRSGDVVTVQIPKLGASGGRGDFAT